MSEKVQTTSPGQEELRARREQIEAQRAAIEHEASVLSREEAFGKFDDDVKPADGEVSYADYAATRPHELVKADGTIRYEETGKFGSSEAFAQQNESQQDYYDRVGGLVNEGEWEKPDYESMGVAQLAKEASKARALGDKATEEDVLEAAINNLTMDAMKDDSESAEDAQKRFESEMDRFSRLVDAFDKKAAAGNGASPEASAANGGVPEASAAGSDAPEASTPDTKGGEAGSDGSKASTPEAGAGQTPESKPRPLIVEVEMGGERYALGEVFVGPSGKKIVELFRGNGTSIYASESEITPVDIEPEAGEDTGVEASLEGTQADAEATVAEAPNAADSETIEPVKAPSKELVVHETESFAAKAEAAKGKELVPLEVEEENKKSVIERLKSWAKQERTLYQKVGGAAYWGEAWNRAKGKFNDTFLNHGIEDDMSEEEKEKTRKKNRRFLIAGVAAVGVVSIAAAVVAGQDMFDGTASASDLLPTDAPSGELANGGGVGVGTGGESLAGDGGVLNPDTAMGGGPESIPRDLVDFEPVDVRYGMGGEELFQNMNLDKADWYVHAEDLLNKFPDDFYRMSDGGVGIAKPGELPADVQQYIEALKN